MKSMIKYLFPLMFLLVIFSSCQHDPPLAVDGRGELTIFAIGDTALADTIPQFMNMSNAKVILASEYGMIIKYTDANGVLNLSGLPASTYSITVRMPHPLNPNILLVGNLRDLAISEGMIVDTIFAEQIANTGLCINEIYAGGPVNNIYFFYDQFVEIYNYSDSVKYLDGMMVMRVSGNSEGKGPGADEGDDNDIDGVTYVFKFPGKPGEMNYPILPKTFKVLASTGVNHKNTVSTSIDLSTADWEFYNQFSFSDFDNPNVPNLINMRSDRTVDFLINLVGDVIVISSGVDSVWEDGIDISTVIDGIQYKGSHTARKTLDVRIDKSYTLSPPRYSGKSMRRREPGVDTNDGLLDWENTPAPTPGYH
ncbi:MAG: DUF4876 domain-containing protein [Ignavibacteriaceae bacterium]|nr:DUF4876 domain-containing protein [Ignavibacteriaceae bacterium]HRI46011.1 DUF4876 domain-containing protein [Ignavibacteriaceae bacterium]